MEFCLPMRIFESRYKKEKNARAKTRLHVLLLRRQKYAQQEIAAIIHVTQGTVSNVCRRFLKEGFDSVYDKPRSGKPARLSTQQKLALRERVAHEYTDGKIRRGWQTKDVISLLRDEFNVHYTQRHVERLLNKIGMSWKVPRPEHKNRDENAVRTFKKISRGRPSLWQPATQSSA